jgi:hypothetical protein
VEPAHRSHSRRHISDGIGSPLSRGSSVPQGKRGRILDRPDAENADPDVLMQQTSRYFTALTDVILAQGGTVDKFVGDAVMAF